MRTPNRRKLNWFEIKERDEMAAILREKGVVITKYTPKVIVTYGNNSGSVTWYNDSVTRQFLKENDFSNPAAMSVHELCSALTYMAAGQYETLLARQICVKANTVALYDACHTYADRSARVQATLKNYGIRML